MAVFNASAWFGSIFFGTRREQAKLTEPVQAERSPTTPDGALQLGTVWACVRLLSETIGTLPLGVYSKDEQGRRNAFKGEGLYTLLHDSPNADQSAAEFWEVVVACLCLWGNFYAEKVFNGVGALIALNFMHPASVGVYRDANAARRYRHTTPTGHRREFGEDEVFHVRGFGVGGDTGLSPIGYARKSLGLALDTDEAAGSAFRNGARPSGFLVANTNTVTPQQGKELRETFVDPITGPSATAKVGILPKALDWKEIKGMPPEDMQLLQGRAFNVEELCRWYRVPPFMIGHTEKSSSWGTGLEQQTIGFLTFSLRPYLTRIEQAVKKQLIPARLRETVYAEFNLEGLLRADSHGRAALNSTNAQNGIDTRNEIRARENKAPLPGGDVLTVQSNLVPLDQLGQQAGATSDQQARSAMSNWLFGGDLQALVASAVAAAAKAKPDNEGGGSPAQEASA